MGETNEVPKTISSGVPSAENKEPQQKAAELAKATRERGMGGLWGKFPPRLDSEKNGKYVREFTSIGYFIQGKETNQPLGLIWPQNPPGFTDLKEKRDRQIWTRSKYVPPMETEEVEVTQEKRVRGFLGLPKVEKKIQKKHVPTNTPKTYNGKKGGPDWIQFSFHIPIIHYLDTRQTSVDLSIAVPPDIASQIDEQINKNIYFPDAFVQALYPGHIGPDPKQHITRIPAKELQIVDLTGNKQTDKVLQYPQPIPY